MRIPIPENAVEVKMPGRIGTYFLNSDPVKPAFTWVTNALGTDGTSYQFSPDKVIVTSHSTHDPNYDNVKTTVENPSDRFWELQETLQELIDYAEPLSPSNSTHELIRGASQIILDQRDLSTPAPLAPMLKKAREINAWEIHGGNRKEELQYFPTFESLFRNAFLGRLLKLTGDKTKITGMDLLTSYEQAVEESTDKIRNPFIRNNMFMPLAYGRFLDYFDIPIKQSLIEELTTKYPDAAREYREQAERWTKGIVNMPTLNATL